MLGNLMDQETAKYQKTCKDCGEGFDWEQPKRGMALEYVDHIKTCGIESIYLKDSNKNKKKEQSYSIQNYMANIMQLEPEIDMCVKEDVEIKQENPSDYDLNIEIQTEPTFDQNTKVEVVKIDVKTDLDSYEGDDFEATYVIWPKIWILKC